MEKIKSNRKLINKANVINLAILLIYCALLIVLAIRHEPWRDEAQQWLIVRDLSIPDIISQMKYEGHPCLWYLILVPLVKLGAPYGSATILGIIFCVIAVALMLWKSNLPLWTKVLPLLTCSFLFYCPIVARSYCLIPLFVFLNAYLYDKRFDKPILFGLTIALIVQTHIVMIGFAAMLSLVWLIDALKQFRKNKDKKFLLNQSLGLFEALISAILLYLQLANVSESSSFNIASISVELFQTSLVYILQGSLWTYNMYGTAFVALMLIVLLLFALIYIFKEKNFDLLRTYIVFVFSILVMAAISTFVYALSNHVWQVVVTLLVWLMWTSRSNLSSKDLKILFYALFVIALVPWLYLNVATTYKDLRYNYSESKQCAEYIENSLDANAVIFCEDTGYDPAIAVYLKNQKIYSLVSGNQMSFKTWSDGTYSIFGYTAIVDKAKEINPNVSDIYIVLNASTLFTYVTLPQYIPYGGEITYSTDQNCVTDDSFIVIKINLE